MSTLAQIRNEVARKVGLDTTAAGTDETLVDEWANEAVLDVLLETRCYVRSATMTATDGSADYTLDTDILHVVDLYLTDSGQNYRLRQVAPGQIIDMRVSANSQEDAPATHFAVAGSNLLMLYPTPSSAYTLTVYYVPRPTVMSSGTHDPSDVTYGGVPKEFHRAIKLYVLAEAADYRDDASSAQGERYRQQYQQQLGKVRKAVNQKGHTTTAAFRVVGQVFPPHDPSTDVR